MPGPPAEVTRIDLHAGGTVDSRHLTIAERCPGRAARAGQLSYQAMELSSERGLLFLADTAEPGSASHDGLQLLASWTATDEPVART